VLNDLFRIEARNGIGRAKTVPEDEYEAVYAQIFEDMENQINEVAERGEED
jgi:V/A-type H+-transporting ATPase subunit A